MSRLPNVYRASQCLASLGIRSLGAVVNGKIYAIGGRLGSTIGNKLRRLAEHHQVLCITHLPQIAAYADRHLTVRKETIGNATETKVRLMEGKESVSELFQRAKLQHRCMNCFRCGRNALNSAESIP